MNGVFRHHGDPCNKDRETLETIVREHPDIDQSGLTDAAMGKGAPKFQNNNFNPNCSCRFARAVLEIDPNCAFPNVNAGVPNCGWLNKLNPSALNSTRIPSRHLIGKFRCNETSVLTIPGPVKILRPALPITYGAGNTNADVSNHFATAGLSNLPFAIRFGQLVVPVFALSKFRFRVNGSPPDKVVIPLNAQPPNKYDAGPDVTYFFPAPNGKSQNPLTTPRCPVW